MQDPMPSHRLSLSAIEGSRNSIDSLFTDTPQFESETLSEALGCRLTLKVETVNPIRSFKGRGVDFLLGELAKRSDNRPLVCASTGNFGQAMAWACRKRERQVVVYASKGANAMKMGRIRDMGADTRLVGVDFDEAKLRARDLCDQTGALMVEDGCQPEISEGAGSIGVELMNSQPFDVVILPVGNGALISGVGRWLKAISPNTRVIGIAASGADSMEASWRGSSIVARGEVNTIAEGIAVRIPVPEAVADMRSVVDEMILVPDQSLLNAMMQVYSLAGILIEPAAAAGVAAIQDNPERFAGRRIATVLTGSNVTREQMSDWLKYST